MRAGERSRFEAVYRAYRGLMYHVAYGVLRNDQDAEDAVHQAFLSMAEHLDKLPPAGSAQAKVYAATIAERKAIDAWRARQRHPTADLDALPLPLAAPPEGGLAGALAALPPRYREVLLLKYHVGYENEEIASLLDTTSGNVRQLLSRARGRLAEALRERGEPYE